ncbi:MAG: threonine synthase [Candidatus Jacksonbacteria bacterium]
MSYLKFYSTNQQIKPISFKKAALSGLAQDGGLFMPVKIPNLTNDFLKTLDPLEFPEIALKLSKKWLCKDMPNPFLSDITRKAFNFPAPLVQIDENLYILELFHGQTLSFKDFGARFMALIMSHLVKNENKKLTILTATSGDTGSAVASAFFMIPQVQVVVLYPKGKISPMQEEQMTTFGGNITALEINGCFDDCQKIVKQTFLDPKLQKKLFLTSANSINIARLIPQSFYYFNAYTQLKDKNLPIVFSIPCGNFGNLTGGLLAKKMGLPIHKFIASTNINNVVPKYLKTGLFQPQHSKSTIANSMDVGNPSNFARILDLYQHNYKKIREHIFGADFSDKQICWAIKKVWQKYHYLLDPHSAAGYLGLKEYLKQNNQSVNGIVLATAHMIDKTSLIN